MTDDRTPRIWPWHDAFKALQLVVEQRDQAMDAASAHYAPSIHDLRIRLAQDYTGFKAGDVLISYREKKRIRLTHIAFTGEERELIAITRPHTIQWTGWGVILNTDGTDRDGNIMIMIDSTDSWTLWKARPINLNKGDFMQTVRLMIDITQPAAIEGRHDEGLIAVGVSPHGRAPFSQIISAPNTPENRTHALDLVQGILAHGFDFDRMLPADRVALREDEARNLLGVNDHRHPLNATQTVQQQTSGHDADMRLVPRYSPDHDAISWKANVDIEKITDINTEGVEIGHHGAIMAIGAGPAYATVNTNKGPIDLKPGEVALLDAEHNRVDAHGAPLVSDTIDTRPDGGHNDH